MSAAKVELGRHLFYDTRLSQDGSYSCASCHQQALAFTDGLAHAEGVTGQLHPRSAMSLANVAYASSLAWANPSLVELEAHALGPLFGTAPVEQGLIDEADLLARIADEPRYDALFADAYPDDAQPRTLAHVAQAIAAFERTIISGRAPFDRWFFEGDESAISESAKRGWALFNFPGQCTYCHFNFDYSDSTYFASLPARTTPFHNTGLYDLDGAGAYPEGNEGLMRISGDPADMGKFKSPTLRNIAVTAPYMHDGSISTLQEVLEHYAAGGRAGGPLVDPRVKPFVLKADELADFLAFFDSLTDEALLTDPALADPW
jgi:cytochrome c peroxidase